MKRDIVSIDIPFFKRKEMGNISTSKKAILMVVFINIFIALLIYGGYVNHLTSTGNIKNVTVINRHDQSKKEIYVVLLKTGCKDCEHAKPKLIPAIKRAKRQGKHIYIVDIAKLTNKEISTLKSQLKPVLYDNKIATPTTAKICVDSSNIRVDSFDNTGNVAKQVNILTGGD